MSPVQVLVWVTEATWPACVAAAQSYVPPDAQITVLYVESDDLAGAAEGAYAGLLGRARPRADPARRVREIAEQAGRELLDAAVQEIGREARTVYRSGRLEQVVVDACRGVDLLILARDGETQRLGPHSIGHASRFILDHAPCDVLLVGVEPPPR
jgi:nucleotide-binding universal stress UspA family protein